MTPRDLNRLAADIVAEATGDKVARCPLPKDQAAVETGRQGGKARAEKLTPERRSEISSDRCQSTWEEGHQSVPTTACISLDLPGAS